MEQQNTGSNLFELSIDHTAGGHLKEAAKWAKFFSILGFIFTGLIVLSAIFAGSIFSSMAGAMGGSMGSAAAMSGGFITILYLIVAAIYFFPCLYLFKFSTKMQVALRSNDQESLNNSFKNLKACYRYIGILTIIWLGFVLLILLFGVIGMVGR